MSDSWPDLAGRPVAGGHVIGVRVYFEDTDHSGVVYHANYLRFMERGRSDFVRLLGIGHTELDRGAHGERLAFAVRKMMVEFHKPARIDDLLEVETRLLELAGARIVLHQAVRRAKETLVEAEVTVVLLNREGRARRIPQSVRDALAGSAAS